MYEYRFEDDGLISPRRQDGPSSPAVSQGKSTGSLRHCTPSAQLHLKAYFTVASHLYLYLLLESSRLAIKMAGQSVCTFEDRLSSGQNAAQDVAQGGLSHADHGHIHDHDHGHGHSHDHAGRTAADEHGHTHEHMENAGRSAFLRLIFGRRMTTGGRVSSDLDQEPSPR